MIFPKQQHKLKFFSYYTFILFLVTVLFSSCKKETIETESQPLFPQNDISKFAEEKLPADIFKSINWNALKTITHADTIFGWMVSPRTIVNDEVNSILIYSKAGKPVEIVTYFIDSRKKLESGKGKVIFNRKAFVSGKEINELLDLDKIRIESQHADSGRINRMSLTQPYSTLPEVVVYGQKKRKPLYINSTSIYDGHADQVYVPILDQSGGGDVGGGGSNGGNNGNYLDEEIIDLSKFNEFLIYQGLYLFTPDEYPGKEMEWPWRWWESLNNEDRIAIEKVKNEFSEDAITPELCKGTNRFGGHPQYKGTGEHIIIQFDYLSQFPGFAEREYSIPNSSLTGNTGYADLVNTLTKEIFEIKPENNPYEIANGIQEVSRYVKNACLFCGGIFIKGKNYDERILPYPGKPSMNMKVRLREDGIITYEAVTKSSNPIPVAVPESISKKLKDFFVILLYSQIFTDEMIVYWLKKNPEVKNYLITASVALIIATIIDDVVTTGIGIANDISSILLAMRMIRLARTIP